MKKKVLLSSVLIIALCLSLIAGSTFALFTSESSVNIAVTAGSVEVVASIDELSLYSPAAIDMNGNITDEDNAAGENFANGGTAVYEDAVLTLTNITPGDRVEFNIRIENKSNVKIVYRTVVSYTGSKTLFKKLNINIGGKSTASKSEWVALDAEAPIEDLACYVELPADAGNEYQNLSCTIQFAVEAAQGNADYSADGVYVSTLSELNEAIANGAKKIILNNDIKTTISSAEDIPAYNALGTYTTWGCLANITDDLTIDTNGYEISAYNEAAENDNFIAIFIVAPNAKLTIIGNGTIRTGGVDSDRAVYGVWARGGSIDIVDSNFINENPVSSNGETTSPLVYISEPTGEIHIYGGTYTYPPCSWCQSCTNAANDMTQRVITVHEGARFSQSFFMEWSDFPRIGLAEDCELRQTVIDGTTWYEVFKSTD